MDGVGDDEGARGAVIAAPREVVEPTLEAIGGDSLADLRKDLRKNGIGSRVIHRGKRKVVRGM